MAKKQKALDLARRRELVARMALQGKRQFEIAAELQIDQSTVCRDLEAVERGWQRGAQADIATLRARQLAEIEETRRQACRSFEASKAGGRAGDPRFLRLELECTGQMAKLLGVNTPVKVAETDAEKQPKRHTRWCKQASSRRNAKPTQPMKKWRVCANNSRQRRVSSSPSPTT